jgi:hypothetical protein
MYICACFQNLGYFVAYKGFGPVSIICCLFFLKNIKCNLNQGHNGPLHENKPFLELEQSCVLNITTCSTNSMVELLHGGVRRAELEK